MDVQTTITLTQREEDFIWALGQGLPPTRAATVAGWAVGSASRLMYKPHIRAALMALRDNMDQALRKLEKREGSFDEVEQGV